MFRLNRGSFARNSLIESWTYLLLNFFVLSKILRPMFSVETNVGFEAAIVSLGGILMLIRIIYGLRNFKRHVALRVVMDEIGQVDVSEKMEEELYKKIRFLIRSFREATKTVTPQYGAIIIGHAKRLYIAGQIVDLISPDNTWEAFLDEEVWCSDETEDHSQN